MREYIFTSELFTGEILFGYDPDGVLVKFENRAKLSDVQLKFLSKNFPFSDGDLQLIVGKQGKITEITDLSFVRFWDEYGFKVGNKVQAEKLWNKLGESDKVRVFDHLPKYRYYLKTHPGIMQAYPTTFLNQHRWENEF